MTFYLAGISLDELDRVRDNQSNYAITHGKPEHRDHAQLYAFDIKQIESGLIELYGGSQSPAYVERTLHDLGYPNARAAYDKAVLLGKPGSTTFGELARKYTGNFRTHFDDEGNFYMECGVKGDEVEAIYTRAAYKFSFPLDNSPMQLLPVTTLTADS